MNKLILSLFPGIDLFSIPFEESGFSVVRGPDLIFGRDIRDFHVPAGAFGGVIAGSPCQEFSSLNRNVPTGYGLDMLAEFKRLVLESQPDWWLLENVPRVPDVKIDGYNWQRFSLDLAWFSDCSRLRHFQFGSKNGVVLNPPIMITEPVTHSAAVASDDRSFAQIKHLQGLPDEYDLPEFNIAGKKKVVGNGVPLPLGRVLVRLIDHHVYGVTHLANKSVTCRPCKSVTSRGGVTVSGPAQKNVTQSGGETVTRPGAEAVTCLCGCGRSVIGRAKYASAACRKRVSRLRCSS